MRNTLTLIMVVLPASFGLALGAENGHRIDTKRSPETRAMTRDAWAVRDVPAEVLKLLPTPDWSAQEAHFGRSVALNGDTMVVGVVDDEQGVEAGAAYIFSRNQGGAGTWGQVAKLVPTDGSPYDSFGSKVAIDGDTVVVAAVRDDDNGVDSGSVYIFGRNQGGPDAWGQLAKVTASNGAAADYFGASVAINGDTLVVGASRADSSGPFSGSAYVFGRNVGGVEAWGEVMALAVADGGSGDRFGASVAIDGDTVVVGAPEDDDIDFNSGAAYIFGRNVGGAEVWGQMAKLVRLDGGAGDFFGQSVGIDNDSVAVGATGAEGTSAYSYPGGCFIFGRNQGGPDAWGQLAKLFAADGESGDRFGSSVGIDGDTVVVGAPRDDNFQIDSGSAYIFERDAGGAEVWGEVAKLSNSGWTSGDWAGISVAIAGDTVVVGAPRDDENGMNSGSLSLFDRNLGGANTWGRSVEKPAPDALTARSFMFGSSSAIDGDTVVIGVVGDDVNGYESGSAFVFQRNQGGEEAWGQVAKLAPSDGAFLDSFGISVGIAGDTIIVGAPNDDDNGEDSGAAYIFGRNQGGNDAWGEVTKLLASDGAEGNRLGWAVGIDGDTVVVGAPHFYSSNPGAAYIFARNQGGVDIWGEVAKLGALTGENGDQFGRSVAIDGSIVVVGAPDAAGSTALSGAAFTFYRIGSNPGAWLQIAELTDTDGWETYSFGCSVAIDGSTIVVGASGYDSGAGSAWLFGRDQEGDDAWGRVAKVTASDGAAYEHFGSSVGIDGDVIVVGAPEYDGAGGAFVFRRNAGGLDAWGEVAALAPSDGMLDDGFGASVGITGDTAVVGAPNDDENSTESGSVSVFRGVAPNPVVTSVHTSPGLPSGFLGFGQWVPVGFTDFHVFFDVKLDNPPGDSQPDDCTNADNWLLVEAGLDGIVQTIGCDAGIAGDDQARILTGFAAAAMTPGMRVDFSADDGPALGEGHYSLLACGTLRGEQGGALDGNGDGWGGDDFLLPFGVDLTPPTSPSNVTTSTHQSPSQETVIETSWTAATDGLSGVDGYAWAFSEADHWVCDGIIDGGGTTATSTTLADGIWWFHVCAIDRAGNGSGAVSLGPMVIDTTAPAVWSIGSEGGTWDGVLSEGESALAAITQLMIEFSEPINPNSGGRDVADSGHYRLIALGPNRVLETPGCSDRLVGDDDQISISGVWPWTDPKIISVRNDLSKGLPAGRYALLVCDVEDVVGNLLEGSWIGGFAVSATNDFENPNFDDGLAGEWETLSPDPSDIRFLATDPTSETSGVVLVETSAGAGETYEITQCLTVAEGRAYGLGGVAMIQSTQADAPILKGSAQFYRDEGCVDVLEMSETVIARGDSSGLWGARLIVPFRAPLEARSVRVGFVVEGSSAEEFSLYLDETSFFEDVIFVDGFEKGDATWWTKQSR